MAVGPAVVDAAGAAAPPGAAARPRRAAAAGLRAASLAGVLGLPSARGLSPACAGRPELEAYRRLPEHLASLVELPDGSRYWFQPCDGAACAQPCESHLSYQIDCHGPLRHIKVGGAPQFTLCVPAPCTSTGNLLNIAAAVRRREREYQFQMYLAAMCRDQDLEECLLDIPCKIHVTFAVNCSHGAMVAVNQDGLQAILVDSALPVPCEEVQGLLPQAPRALRALLQAPPHVAAALTAGFVWVIDALQERPFAATAPLFVAVLALGLCCCGHLCCSWGPQPALSLASAPSPPRKARTGLLHQEAEEDASARGRHAGWSEDLLPLTLTGRLEAGHGSAVVSVDPATSQETLGFCGPAGTYLPKSSGQLGRGAGSLGFARCARLF